VALFFYLYIKINDMKIKLKIDISKDGQIIPAGEIIEINDNNSSKWVSKGWGELFQKEIKAKKKETKELKIDSKETKHETNKD